MGMAVASNSYGGTKHLALRNCLYIPAPHHQHVGHGPERSQLLHWLVGGAILTQTDGVMCKHCIYVKLRAKVCVRDDHCQGRPTHVAPIKILA
eukprot:1141812-Pelagomonas_calceolata.AAC.2